MFREIRTTEKITEETKKRNQRREQLLMEVFDALVGSERHAQALAALKAFDEADQPEVNFDPDKLITW